MHSSPFFGGARYARAPLAALAVTITLSVGAACDRERGSDADELAELAAFGLSIGEIPASPTNAFADDSAAANLGRRLFFDKRMSSERTVACVDCHDPERGFSDARAMSLGVQGQLGKRHALPVTSAALQPFLLWDGRADSVWRQPLLALENPREMSFTRVDVARFVEAEYATEYEAIFGALPDLSRAPQHGRPGDEAWETLDPAMQDDIQRVFVNVGKAIEAYERELTCADTRFDRWTRGELELTTDELDGAARFVQSGCTGCHTGVAFADGKFHNLGLSPLNVPEPDLGRAAAFEDLERDELNGASVYSDDPAFGALRLAEARSEGSTRGAFRTASLRGVTQRARFGHRGAHTDLADFIDDTYRNRGRGGGGGRGGNDDDDDDIVGALDELLDDVNVDGGDAQAIVRFLRTLECPTPPAELLAP